MNFSIRRAVESDIATIFSFDQLAQADGGRRDFIARSVAEGSCFVVAAAADGSAPLAYAVLEYSFYGYGFISMLYVDAHHRRQGHGAALINHLEAACATEKLFTSTNLSNGVMQALLARLGYKSSGIIYNLDEDDPELVYCKALRRGPEFLDHL